MKNKILSTLFTLLVISSYSYGYVNVTNEDYAMQYFLEYNGSFEQYSKNNKTPYYQTYNEPTPETEDHSQLNNVEIQTNAGEGSKGNNISLLIFMLVSGIIGLLITVLCNPITWLVLIFFAIISR